MSLKKQFKDELKRRKQLKKQQSKKQIDEQCLSRTAKEWKIIDEYLSDLLISLASGKLKNDGDDGNISYHGLFKKCIRLKAFGIESYLANPKDKEGKAIYLQEDKKLIIGQEDIKRFCKEHELRLKYGYSNVDGSIVTRNSYNYEGLNWFIIIM